MNLLEFRKASVMENGITLLHGVDFALEAGQKLLVFGPSGSGKGLLLRLAAGVLEPSSGAVVLASRGAGRRAPVGFVTSEGGLLNNLSLLSNVILPAVYHRLLEPAAAGRRARELLEDFGISGQARRRPAEATLAAKRLAQLARALLVEPSVFVLEDPLSEIDAASARAIRRALARIGESPDSCAIVATGSLGPYREWAGRFLLLREGRAQLFESLEELAKSSDPEVSVFLKAP